MKDQWTAEGNRLWHKMFPVPPPNDIQRSETAHNDMLTL
jgi:hypothetical protein